MTDFVLNGWIDLPSGTPAFLDGDVILLTPRAARSKDLANNLSSPYLGYSAMACCPDINTPLCKAIINANAACPLKTSTPEQCRGTGKTCAPVLETVLPTDSPYSTGSWCAKHMCVKLKNPPSRIGAVIDLQVHTEGIPVPLKFVNIGEKQGSLVLFRKSGAYYYNKYLYSNDSKTNPALSAALDEGMYKGRVISKQSLDLPAARNNHLIIMNLGNSQIETLPPMSIYCIDPGWENPNIVVNNMTLSIGMRVIDKTDNAPCFIICFDSKVGSELKMTAKQSLKTVTVLTDLEEVRVLTFDKLIVNNNLKNSFDMYNTTALRKNQYDAKYRYSYFNGIELQYTDPLFIIMNTGSDEIWQRVMEVHVSDQPANTAQNARNITPLEMHTYLGIKNDSDESATNFYNTEEKRTTKLNLVRKMLSNQYSLRWTGTYLELRKESANVSRPSTSAENQLNKGIASEQNSLILECKQAVHNVEDVPVVQLQAQCESDIKVHQIYGRMSTKTITTSDILYDCGEPGKIMSKICMEAARLSDRDSVQSSLQDAFVYHCKMVPRDPRCQLNENSSAMQANAYDFINHDTIGIPEFNVRYYYDYWPLALVVILGVIYCVYAAYKYKNKAFYLKIAGSLTVAAILTKLIFPVATDDALVGLANAFTIGNLI